jgi:opacity protein-like surface antigen
MNAGKKMLAALAIAGVLASGAYAQESSAVTKVQKPFSVKIGGAFFNDGDTKDAIGNSTFTVGLGYDFLKTKATNPIIVQGYLDYFAPKSRERSVTAGGVTNTIESKLEYAFGLGVAGRYAFITEPTANFVPYAGLGLGFYSLKVKTDVSSVGGSSPFSNAESNTKNGLGGKIFAGVEIKQGIFGELEYNFLPKVEDADLSSFGARIGYRF